MADNLIVQPTHLLDVCHTAVQVTDIVLVDSVVPVRLHQLPIRDCLGLPSQVLGQLGVDIGVLCCLAHLRCSCHGRPLVCCHLGFLVKIRVVWVEWLWGVQI